MSTGISVAGSMISLSGVSRLVLTSALTATPPCGRIAGSTT